MKQILPFIIFLSLMLNLSLSAHAGNPPLPDEDDFASEVTPAPGAGDDDDSLSNTLTNGSGDDELVTDEPKEPDEPVAPMLMPMAASGAVTLPSGWISGDIHIHSTHSDGSGSMAQNFAAGKNAGIGFINIADHDTSSGWTEAQSAGAATGIIPIQGNEYSGFGHATFVNVDRNYNYNQGRIPKDAVALMKTHTGGRGLAYAAHPYDGTLGPDPWGANDSWNAAIDGIEVWSGWYGPRYSANMQAFAKWDDLNRKGRRLYGVAGTDAHSSEGVGAVYTTVYAGSNTSSGIIDGMSKGRMYGSNGPVISFSAAGAMMGDTVDIPMGGKTIEVEMSGYYTEDLAKVILIINGTEYSAYDIDAPSFAITESITVTPGDFIRMEVEGKTGSGKSLTTGSYNTPSFFSQAPFAFSNPIFFSGFSHIITLPRPAGYAGTSIYLDGVEHAATLNNGQLVVDAKNGNAKTAVMYKYNASNVPDGMYVWTLSYKNGAYTAAAVPQLENLLTYHGFSIRITGDTGIRVKTGISVTVRNQLTSSAGLAGFKLQEYGTLVMTDARIKEGYNFVKGGQYVNGGLAYGMDNGKLLDAVFETVEGRYRYTSVLTKLPPAQYKTDFVFRGFIDLNKDGINYTVYGPPVQRSLYTLAGQVIASGQYTSGSEADLFLKKILQDAP